MVTVVVIFHLGGSFALHTAQSFTMYGTLVAALLTLGSILYPRQRKEQTEPWNGLEQWSWVLIGCGSVAWSFGEIIWRYYASLGLNPFPSTADFGFSLFPLLVLAGLLLQPHPHARSRRTLLLMDSLISMGSILAIAWDVLLGSLALASGETTLARFLGLYYPLTDTALLSCVLFLLLRGTDQSRTRRVSLLLIALGLCVYTISDFLFNVLNNLNLYTDGTWVDLGWPLGLLTIGIAAYLRRFLSSRDEQGAHTRSRQRPSQASFSPIQLLPYGLLGILLTVLILNVLSSESEQVAIRPVLLYATVAIIALVVVRQIVTLWDNIQLSQRQAEALTELERANQQITEQARHIAERNSELEQGIAHLTLVQTRLANGHLHTRATLKGGVLLPLAGSLNIMAERLMRIGQENSHGQRLTRDLRTVLASLEGSRRGAPLSIPQPYADTPEINHLLTLLRLKGLFLSPSPDQPGEGRPLVSRPETELRTQASAPPFVSSPGTLHLKERYDPDVPRKKQQLAAKTDSNTYENKEKE